MYEYMSNGKPIEYTMKGYVIDPRRCPICGQYLCKDASYYLIILNGREEFRNIKVKNMTPHISCWNEFCKDIKDTDDFIKKITKNRIPRCKGYTIEEENKINAFLQATKEKGFYLNGTQKKNGSVKVSKRGTSAILTYNPYTEAIKYDDRCRRGLFDGFFINEIYSKIRNRMNEILGLEVKEEYNASTEFK